MLVRVPTIKTNFTITDFTTTCIKAWYDIYQSLPHKEQIAIVYAQWALETGVGTFCWCWNIGNTKAYDISGTQVKYCVLQNVWEIINGKKIILPPENPGSWFMAFDNLNDGMNYHLNFLRNKRYKIAWEAVEAGNPAQFGKLLKQQGYYTASESDYVRALQYHFNKFMKDDTFDRTVSQMQDDESKIEFPSDFKPLLLKSKSIWSKLKDILG